MLEEKIEELTKAITELTAAMGNGEEKPAKKAPVKKTAPKKGAAKKVTLAQVRNALRKVQSEVGKDTAKSILTDFDVAKLTELEEADYAEFIEACDEALEEEGDEEEDEED